MKIEVRGSLPSKYLIDTVQKLQHVIKVPRNAEFYFFASESDGEDLIASLHKHAQKAMRYVLLEERNSFSYNHRGRKIIVVLVDRKQYLLTNKKALLGLLLHEMMHIKQQDRGLYIYIKNAFEQTFLKNERLLNKLHYQKKKIQSLFNIVGSTSILLLKDLFANSELIAASKGKYLLEYYRAELLNRKTCPRPVFYDKFKEAAQKNLDVIAIAFEFEFALLATLLPFQKYADKKAETLVRHINRCYEMNVQEIARKCHELIYLYLHEFAYDEKFAKRFLNAIFNKVYLLLV